MRVFILLLSMSSLPSILGATSPVDSLKRLYYSNSAQVDSHQMKLCKQLGDSLHLLQPDTALFFYEKGMNLAKAMRDTSEWVSLAGEVGNIHQRMNRELEALEYLRRSYLLSKEYGKVEPRSVAYLLINIGNIYFSEELYSVARSYYQKAEDAFISIQDTNGLLLSWKNVGLIFDRQDKCDSSVFYYRKALNIELELPERAHEKAMLYNYLSMVYGCYKDKGQERVQYMRKAEEYFQQSGGEEKDPKLRLSFYFNFASSFRMAGELDSADHYVELFEQGLERWPEYKGLFKVSHLSILKGLAASRGNYSRAIELTWEVINDSLMNPKSIYKQHKVLSDLYALAGNTKAAFKYLKLYTSELAKRNKDKFADKVVKMYAAMENFEQRRALEVKDLALQKEQVLKEKEAEARRVYSAAFTGVALLLLALGFLYRRLRRSKEQLQVQHNIIETNAMELKELNQTKDKLMSILAHDLRGPFSNMLQLSDRLSKQLQQQPMASQSQALAEGLSKTAKSSYLLFEDLLSWSKNQSGALQVNLQALALPSLAEEVLALFQSQLYAKSIRVEQDWQVPGLYADQEMVRTIFRNLIGNALQYSPAGGVLCLGSQMEGETVCICIEDTGGRIPAAALPTLFSEEKWKQRRGNSGLGLVLCKQFMAKQGGEINVRVEEGRSTRFELLFPGAVAEVATSATQSDVQRFWTPPSRALLLQFLTTWEALESLQITEATQLLRLSQPLLKEAPELKGYLEIWREAVLQQQKDVFYQIQGQLTKAIQSVRQTQA